jgi:DNA-binding beta-propeller fold protein YncE
VFDKATGTVVKQFGSAGTGHGQLQSPDAVSVDSNLIYVTDNSNHRVQVRQWTLATAHLMHASCLDGITESLSGAVA